MRYLLFFLLLLVACQKEEMIESNLEMQVDTLSIKADRGLRASSYNSLTQPMKICGSWTINATESGSIDINLEDYDNKPGEKHFTSQEGIIIKLVHINISGAQTTDYYFAHGNDASLIISDVNESFITGSFQCVGRKTTGETLSVTNGSFKIKRG